MAVFILALPLVAVVVVCYLAGYAVAWLVLHLMIWTWWNARGRDVLFVYSNSPVWLPHIEHNILPYLDRRALVLNWSERKRWRFSLARLAFRFFGGRREFNPLAVVFRPFRRTRIFRFWMAFRDLKHGRPEALEALESGFLDCIGLSPGGLDRHRRPT